MPASRIVFAIVGWMSRVPSEELRRRVWEERIAAHTREIYFARLAARYRRLERGLAIVTALFSSATLVAATEFLGVSAVWPALLTGVSGILLGILKFGESSMSMAVHSVAWAKLHYRLEALWIEVESGAVDHEEVSASLALIRENQLYIDDDTAAEPERRRLLLRALDQAEALAS